MSEAPVSTLDFARRRAAYINALGPRACAILTSPPEARRNGDVTFPFRPSSDLYYLTGFGEPDTVLVVRPGATSEETVLFVRPRDPEREVWDGRRAGTDGAIADYGIAASYPIAELGERLPGLMTGFDEVHYTTGIDPDFDARLLAMLANLRARERKGGKAPRRIVDHVATLHEMRLIKQPEEIALLRTAAAITAEAHLAAMKLAAPGISEHQLEAVIDYTFRRRGGVGPGYPSIVGSGDNTTILHYIENSATVSDGDLVLIDAGCEVAFYTADVTRTYPATGQFSGPQRAIYEVVLDAQIAAIDMTRPGLTLDAIHEACTRKLVAGMIDLGLLSGSVDERLADDSYKKFYMHRTSHWLGMDVHDAGSYLSDGGEPRPLAPGMVITIEPGIYVARDAENVPDAFRGIGVRIEDDLLITEAGVENLTAAIPKTVADLEAACRAP